MTLKKENFKDKFEEEWWEKLHPIFDTNIMDKIYGHLKDRGKDGHVIFPTKEHVFRAFKDCAYKDLKIVMIGMEPYSGEINRIPQADGLLFSSSLTNQLQPSLLKFYEGIEDELNIKCDKTPDLKNLAEQGVLLLNYSLTVEKNKISSHADLSLWEPFHQYLIEDVLNQYNPGLIYILLGKHAQKLEKYILPFNNYIFKEHHPSFYVKKDIPWETNGLFLKVNKILKENNNVYFNWNETLPF